METVEEMEYGAAGHCILVVRILARHRRVVAHMPRAICAFFIKYWQDKKHNQCLLAGQGTNDGPPSSANISSSKCTPPNVLLS